MIRKYLRCYSNEERVWRRYIAYWNTLGYQFEQGIKAEGCLFHFSTDSGWEGIIDLRDWYASVMPEQARLASVSCSLVQLQTLFLHCDKPLIDLPVGLEYQRVDSRGLIEATKVGEKLFSCLLPRGRLWLNGKPPTAIFPSGYRGGMDIANVPVTLAFEIGHSAISYGLLKKVRCGDVLLIQHVENKMKTHGDSLAKFIRNEEGYMFEFEDGNEYIENDVSVAEKESSLSSEKKRLLPVDKIKVELGFVIQRSKVSLQTLERFHQGEIVPCNIDAEKNIEIMANGSIVARGELVWFEDRLGVEIKELCHEVKDGPR